MRMFPLQYANWKIRMVINLVTEKREYVVLALSAAVASLIGAVALWYYGSTGLAELLEKNSPKDANRTLSLLAFAIYVAYAFMALANVITRFFGAQRMEERERLLGPLNPTALFFTELLDVSRLPLLILVATVLIPVVGAAWLTDVPLWVAGLISIDMMALYVQPTLAVMAIYIATLRFMPGWLLNRQGLLFVFFVILASAGANALGAIRQAYQSQAGWSMSFPSSWVASIIPFYRSGEVAVVWTQSFRLLLVTLSLLAITYVLYRFAFVQQLERFGVHLATSENQGQEARIDVLLRRFLERRFGKAVSAVVLKDLRSSRRDTAQRIAFTALAAVTFALVLVDVALDHRTATLFLPIFFFYALFLVSCQGLSTFSAEGGILENLARFPLEARDILKAKIISHFLLFCLVIGVSMILAAIAPGQIPFWIRAPAALFFGLLCLPMAGFLAWITVTLGAIFPKPGEGGGRKEISIFAMGLFFQLTCILLISLAFAMVAPISFGAIFVIVPIVIGLSWLGTLTFLYSMAERAVTRALGAEIRAG